MSNNIRDGNSSYTTDRIQAYSSNAQENNKKNQGQQSVGPGKKLDLNAINSTTPLLEYHQHNNKLGEGENSSHIQSVVREVDEEEIIVSAKVKAAQTNNKTVID